MSKNSDSLQVHLRPMTLADLNQVELIDRVSFPTPWPRDAFHYELKRNRSSICWVAECVNPDGGLLLVGSIVIWLVVDEAHIATLAIKPGFRQRGVAQYLLAASLLESIKQGTTRAMLEVRAGNQAAQNLYRKFGFKAVGLRQDYYKDTHEDAILMTLAQLDEEKLAQLADHG